MLIFVYGTLRRGASNHHHLMGAIFAGIARTQARYELVDLGGFPAVLEDGETAVIGELYEVDDALLVQLDAFEDVPVLYERKLVAIDVASIDLAHGNADESIEAYVMPRQRAHFALRIPHGDWLGLQPSAASDPRNQCFILLTKPALHSAKHAETPRIRYRLCKR